MTGKKGIGCSDELAQLLNPKPKALWLQSVPSFGSEGGRCYGYSRHKDSPEFPETQCHGLAVLTLLKQAGPQTWASYNTNCNCPEAAHWRLKRAHRCTQIAFLHCN